MNIYEQEEEDYYQLKEVGRYCNGNYIEYESLSIEEYLNKIRPYFKNIMVDLKEGKSDTWKILLMIVINFMSSKDDDEERVMHLRSNNI